MKLSVSAWSVERKLFAGEMDLFDFIMLCKEKGVKYVELLDCFIKSDSHINEINAFLKKHNMEVSAYSTANNFVQPAPEGRQKQADYVRKSADAANKLGAKLLRIFSGEAAEGVSFDEARKWIVDGLKETAAYAGEKGITMVLENHGLFAGRSSQVAGLIDEVGSEYLKANADVGNFLLVNENPLQAVKALSDYIGFVHFKDFREVDPAETGYTALDGRQYQGVITGKGEVPMKEIVDFLAASHYDGYLSIEYEGIGDPIPGVKESMDFAKAVLK